MAGRVEPLQGGAVKGPPLALAVRRVGPPDVRALVP